MDPAKQGLAGVLFDRPSAFSEDRVDPTVNEWDPKRPFDPLVIESLSSCEAT